MDKHTFYIVVSLILINGKILTLLSTPTLFRIRIQNPEREYYTKKSNTHIIGMDPELAIYPVFFIFSCLWFQLESQDRDVDSGAEEKEKQTTTIWTYFLCHGLLT